VFEPLLLYLFFLYASVNFSQFSIRHFKFLFTQFLFPDRASLVPIYLLFETVSYYSFVFYANYKDAQRQLAHFLLGIIPLNSKVLWSILSSTTIEVLKKRRTLLKFFCPNEEIPECSEMVGMPPAYIVVDIRWDDPEEDINEYKDKNIDQFEEKEINQNENKIDESVKKYWKKTSFVAPRYRFWSEINWNWKIGNNSFFPNQIHPQNEESFFFTRLRGINFKQSKVLKHSMKLKEVYWHQKRMAVITGLLPYLHLETCRDLGGGLYMCGSRHSNLAGQSNTALTENLKGIWYILAGKFNLFLANSAVGVVITLAFANANKGDKSKEYGTKIKRNTWRKVKRKEKYLSAPKSNNCYKFSPFNEEKPAAIAATTFTKAY